MRKFALSVLFAMLAVGAEARPATLSMTCAAAKDLVLRQGAVVFDTSATTYDRLVRDHSFCPLDKVMRPAWVPTRDQPQCLVGYTCESPVPYPGMRL